jgi:hypothetical protein
VNATKLADLHGELELQLLVTGDPGQASSDPGPGSPPRDVIVEVRAEIRHVLVSWCRLVAEKRGIAPPVDTVPTMGAYLAKHAEWLAASEYAGEVADELAGYVSRAWGLAYPNGTRRVEVGPCPLCEGTLTAVVRATDSLLPSEVACDRDEAHRWPSERWRELDRLIAAKRRAAA